MKMNFFLGTPNHNQTYQCDDSCEADEAVEMEDWIVSSYKAYLEDMFAKVSRKFVDWLVHSQ